MEEETAVELPKDAEGREIPLDTEIPYDENGNGYEVYHCKHPVRRTIPWRKRQVVITDYIVHDVSDLHPTPPDSRGEPPMREVGYHCRHCDPTVIFPEKYEPEEVNHDR